LATRLTFPLFASFVLVTKTVKSQLDAIGYQPSKIDYLALSHPHADHIGNANDFAGLIFTSGPTVT